MSIIDSYELDKLYELAHAAKEWMAARDAAINGPVSAEVYDRLARAEAALARQVGKCLTR